MLKSNKSKKSKGSSELRALVSRFKGNRLLEVAIVCVFLLVLMYIVSASLKVTRGISKTLDSPVHVVRLQVLNGCGVDGLAARVADILSDYSDSDLEIKVVDTDDFDVRKVSRTFVISREEDKSGAALLTRKIGLDPSEVVYKPLENNYRQVSVTLVLGEDWKTIGLQIQSCREK